MEISNKIEEYKEKCIFKDYSNDAKYILFNLIYENLVIVCDLKKINYGT